MFKSVVLSDHIRIPPSELARGSEVVSEAIDTKYANRAIPQTGLVLGLFAVDNVRDAYIHPGDGGLHVYGMLPAGPRVPALRPTSFLSAQLLSALLCSLPFLGRS